MRNACLLTCLLTSLLLVGADAGAEEAVVAATHAAPTPRFGIGLAVGHPTGGIARYQLDEKLAVQVGIGTGVVGGSGFYLFTDLQFTPKVLTRTPSFDLPLYVGVGVRLYDDKHERTTRFDEGHDGHLGVRVPVGLRFAFHRAPFDLFVEAALVVDAVVTDSCARCQDDDRLGMSLMLGARYYFGR